MMKKIKYLAIIPARSGSKRIKNKNLKTIKGKSLFDYTLIAAKNSSKIQRVIVTTNINKIIKKKTKKIIYIKRPNNLCLDNSTTEPVIMHSMNFLKKSLKETCENIILLQPTSPFRNSQDIDNAINYFNKNKLDSLFSGYEDKLFLWNKSKRLKPINFEYKKRKMGDKMKKVIIENGAIFIFNYKKFLKFKVRLFGKIGCFLMKEKNSIEIDTPFDLMLAKSISKK